MFKKSRRKIVAAIMSVLVFLFLGTLTIIYGSSYYEVSQSNQEMLERYVSLYSLESQPGDMEVPVNELHPGDMEVPVNEKTTFSLNTFYSVAVSDAGETLGLDNSNPDIYEDSDLVALACEIVQSGKARGAKEKLLYITEDKGDYTLVAFMDNTIMQESMTTLFRYTLVFGSIAIVLFFFLSLQIAKRIVCPLEESYQKQKQFISDAGHELKTPVAVISANAELLAREIGENQWLTNIQYENERMGALITQLLELARTEKVLPQMEHIDFSHLVLGEVLPFESVAFEKGLALICDISEEQYVYGNTVQLRLLTAILIDNAWLWQRKQKQQEN